MWKEDWWMNNYAGCLRLSAELISNAVPNYFTSELYLTHRFEGVDYSTDNLLRCNVRRCVTL